MNPASDVFVSVVAPLRDDAAILEDFVRETVTVLEASYANYELVLVDDCSSDRTGAVVDELLRRHKCVRYLRLARSFGLEVAIAAGLESVIGDFTVVMLPASDPPELIPELVRRARAGRGIVLGVARPGLQPAWSRAGAAFFWWFGRRFLDLDAPRGTTSLAALSRQAVNGLTRIKDKYRSLRLLSQHVGQDAETFPYEPVRRSAGAAPRGFWASVALAIGLVVSHSTRPLRLVSALGLVASTLNLFYMGYVVAIYALKSHVQEGWTTTSLQVSGMFFLLFLILSVLSEYVGRVLEEARDRPLYHVAEERNSNVLVTDAERRNVVRESVAGE